MAAHTRICLIGPEATGKTWLSERLAAEFGGVAIPEYAREYALAVARPLAAADVEEIARGQAALEGKATQVGLVFLDTDLISTVVYARWYYGHCPGWIVDAARLRRADRYLLLDTDVEWTPDPARDAGSAESREDLFDAFRAALDEFETEWSIVSGTWDERWQTVRSVVAAR